MQLTSSSHEEGNERGKFASEIITAFSLRTRGSEDFKHFKQHLKY